VADPNLRVARELLGHLVRQPRPEAAETFVECVHRLGPMVLGVCRRILGNPVEAEDAFQATFLTVFRKWDSVRDRRAIAGWVHRIAVRVAVRLARRRNPAPLGPTPAVESRVVDDLSWKEVRAILDEELDRLPGRLRSPLVLCYLDGMSRETAAESLGWSVRTLHRRLEEGRERLHAALARRGLTGLALGCAVLATEGLRATVPPGLLEAASQLGQQVGRGALAPAVVAAAIPARVPWLGGLSVALAAVVLVFGGWWIQTTDSKPADSKANETSQATTTFEKRPFWWGSEAFRHNGWILDSDLSADGTRLATASWDSFIVWELPTGKKLLHVQESESVSYIGRDRISVVRLSPDGKQLATANKTTGSVIVWEVDTGKRLATVAWDGEIEKTAFEKVGLKTFERRKHSADHHLAIEYVDNTHLRVQSTYFTTTWDTAKNRRTSTEFHPTASDFGITKDRKRVLRSRETSGNNDGIQPALVLWDVAGGKAVREFPIDQRVYETVATLSEDQRYLAATRKSGTEIAVLDWPANKEVAALEFVPAKEHDFIRTMEFSADGKLLYVGSSYGNLIVYDVGTKAKVRSWKACANNLMRIHFAPDGKTLYTTGGDGLVRTWRLPDGKELPVPDGYIGNLVFAWSRARNAMAVGDDQGRIDLWDATGAKITRTLQTKGEPIVQLSFSRSGRLLAASDGKGWTQLWDLDSGNRLAKFGGTEESSGWLYNVLQISDDETKLLVRTGYTIKMYRIPEGKELWQAPPKQMATFALSPNGKMVCASSFNGPPTALYDANTFQRPVALEQTKDMEFPAYDARFTFSPDSRFLALTTPKGKVLFFDGVTGKQRGAQSTQDEELLNLGFTEDGTFLIAINHSKAFLFDAVKFEKLAEVPFDVTTYWRYGTATPGGVEKLLTLFRPKDLAKVDLEACWKKIDSPRPKEVLEAMWQMSESADLGPFLRKKIAPVTPPDAEAIRKQIQDLDSRTFAVREAASRKLGELGSPAEPFLRQALKTGLSAEAVERVERLLADLQHPPSPEEVRQRRVIFALEANGSVDARGTLEAWAAGAAGAHLSEQSKQALGRLAR
jgi:RNA polymerase sigma factor (sigma-70 family)